MIGRLDCPAKKNPWEDAWGLCVLYHAYTIAMLAVHILLYPNSNGVYFAACDAWDFCHHFKRVADASALLRDILQPPLA